MEPTQTSTQDVCGHAQLAVTKKDLWRDGQRGEIMERNTTLQHASCSCHLS